MARRKLATQKDSHIQVYEKFVYGLGYKHGYYLFRQSSALSKTSLYYNRGYCEGKEASMTRREWAYN